MIGGVGQRMLTGVAKKTPASSSPPSTQTLTGESGGGAGEAPVAAGPPPRRAPGRPAPAMPGRLAEAGGGEAGPRCVHRPRAAASPGIAGGEFAAGVALGAAAALLGALVGWLPGPQRAQRADRPCEPFTAAR